MWKPLVIVFSALIVFAVVVWLIASSTLLPSKADAINRLHELHAKVESATAGSTLQLQYMHDEQDLMAEYIIRGVLTREEAYRAIGISESTIQWGMRNFPNMKKGE